KSVTPAFLFGVLLWEPVRQRFEEYLAGGEAANEAMFLAASEICARQQSLVAIPKRFSLPMREIWSMQPRLEQRDGKRPQRLVTHPRFRAAYDFLVLRAEAGEADPELAAWWTRFQEASGQERATMTEGGAKRRRRRPRRRKTADTAGPGTETTGTV
ncbi:MAG: polynucleotide adenylyltransferase PcnB, partial [Gammaproteobacteria bacterium]|nr:polynucleotide adenylyltransferase PcnB [Gammaproteobacteria bacterium]